VSGRVEFFEEWVFREVFIRRWGVGTGVGIFADELLRGMRTWESPKANIRIMTSRMRGGSDRRMYQPDLIEKPDTSSWSESTGETYAMLKNIQVIHPPQLGPDVIHGHLMARVSIYRIMYGQDVYVTVNADRSSAHYRTEEGDFAFCTVEEIS